MKKHLILYLITLSLLFLASCDSVPNVETSTQAVDTAEVTADTAASETSAETNEIEAPIRDGSFSTKLYSVTNVDGVCYLNYVEGNTPAVGNDEYPSQQIGFLSFSSIDELYNMFANNSFSEEQISIMKQAFTHGEHGIVVPNIHQLLVPVLPDDMQIAGVGLTDNVYTYSVKTANSSLGCGIKFAPEELYRALYEKNYSDYFLNKKFSDITSEEGNFNETDCLIYEYKTPVVAKRTYQIRVQDKEKAVSILIHYVTESANQYVEISKTIPDSINVFYEKNGRYMILYLYDFDSEPSLEWLLSFDCSLYEAPNPTT